MYKRLNTAIASFPEHQRETMGKVWYRTHPLFSIFREDLRVENLDTLPDWTFEYHHCVLHNAEEMKNVFSRLFSQNDRNETKKQKYALDWTFAPSFDTVKMEETDVWSSVLESDGVDVSFWDISALASLGYMFDYTRETCITGLQHWDVSQVKTFAYMFGFSRVDLTEASANALDTWDTSAGIMMDGMFYSFTGQMSGLQRWNVSNIESFNSMFAFARVHLTRELKNSLHMWNTSAATDMASMFDNFRGVVTGLSTWDVSHVHYFERMFTNTNVQLTAQYDNSLEHWDTNQAESMKCMLFRFKGQIEGLNKWNVSNVLDFKHMFQESNVDLTSRFTSSLHTWETHRAKSMRSMFESFEGQVTGLQQWNVSNVLKFNQMFQNARINLTEASDNSLRDWNTSNAENMEKMFMDFQGNVTGLDQWDVTHVNKFKDMFRNCRADLSYLTSWTVNAHATGWEHLFQTCNHPSCVIRHLTDLESGFEEWYHQFPPFSFFSHSVRLAPEEPIHRVPFEDGMEVLVHVGNPKCGRTVDAHAWFTFLTSSEQDPFGPLKCLGCFCSPCSLREFRRWTVDLSQVLQDEQSQKWFKEERAEVG